MLKIKSFFPQPFQKQSIGTGNISRDKQYYEKFVSNKLNRTQNGIFQYCNRHSKVLMSTSKNYMNCKQIERVSYNSTFNQSIDSGDHMSQRKLIVPAHKLRNSQKRRQSLLKSYDFIFKQQKNKLCELSSSSGIDPLTSKSSFNNILDSLANQSQLKYPKMLYDFANNSRISASLNLTNSRQSFLIKLDDSAKFNSKNIQNYNVNKINCKLSTKMHSYQVNRKLKKLKHDIQLDKILQSSNLMNIYTQLYNTYEAIPFNEKQQAQQNQEQAEQLRKQAASREYTQKLNQKSQAQLKVYQIVAQQEQKTLKSELKSLTKDTENIIIAGVKELKQFIRN